MVGRFFFAVLAALIFGLSTAPAAAQEAPEPTYGGWSVLGGAGTFALTAALVGFGARAIYAPPEGANCHADPAACKPGAGKHLLVGALAVAGMGVVAAGGWGSGLLAEELGFDPLFGWTGAGAYTGLLIGLFLQRAVPSFEPEWVHLVGTLTFSIASSVGGAIAFRHITKRRGHAWPEFGVGVGAGTLGLIIGQIVAPDTFWPPLLAGLAGLAGAGAATLIWGLEPGATDTGDPPAMALLPPFHF